MKSVLLGMACAAAIAAGAWHVLENEVQQTSTEAFATEGVRLTGVERRGG